MMQPLTQVVMNSPKIRYMDLDGCSDAQDDYIAGGDIGYDNSDDDVSMATVMTSKKMTNYKRSNVNDNVPVVTLIVAPSKERCSNEHCTAGTRHSLCNIDPNTNYCWRYDKNRYDDEDESDIINGCDSDEEYEE